MNCRPGFTFCRFIGLSALVVCLALPTSASAGVIVIDDFMIPTPNEGGFVTSPPLLFKHATGLGGQRDILASRVTGVGSSGSFFVGNGVASPTGTADNNSASNAAIQPVFQYDGVDAGDTTAGLVNAESLGPVDITMAGSNSGFILDFMSIDGTQTTTIDIHSNTNGGPVEMSAVTIVITTSASPTSFFVPFTLFSGVDLGALTSITLTLNAGGTLGADVALDAFSAGTPEPGTFLLLGLGAAAAFGRRLFSRRTIRQSVGAA